MTFFTLIPEPLVYLGGDEIYIREAAGLGFCFSGVKQSEQKSGLLLGQEHIVLLQGN